MANYEGKLQKVQGIGEYDSQQILVETARLRHFGPARRIGSSGLRLARERSSFLVAQTETGRLAERVRDVADRRGLNLRSVFLARSEKGFTQEPSAIQTLEVPTGKPQKLTLASGHTALAAVEGGLSVSYLDEGPIELEGGDVVFLRSQGDAQPEIIVHAAHDQATALLLHGDTQPPIYRGAPIQAAA